MATTGQEEVLKILDDDGSAVLEDWLQTQREEGVRRPDLFSDREIREQASRLLQAFEQGIRKSSEEVMPDLDQEIWEDLRNVLEDVTRERVERGVSAWEMAAFVLALKRPLFARLRKRLNKRPDALIGEVTQLSRLVDAFAMRTNEYFIAEREAIIERQRHEMLELSTPVVQLWERILTIPLIGTLDSVRPAGSPSPPAHAPNRACR
jgi:rsbT co-antagonist protein RsbR